MFEQEKLVPGAKAARKQQTKENALGSKVDGLARSIKYELNHASDNENFNAWCTWFAMGRLGIEWDRPKIVGRASAILASSLRKQHFP